MLHFWTLKTNEEKLTSEYNAIEYFIENKDLYLNLRSELRDICDIEKFHRKIILELVTPYDFYLFYESLKNIKTVYKKIWEDKFIYDYLCKKMNLPNLELLNTINLLNLESNLIMNLRL